jgi:hypothetical protein
MELRRGRAWGGGGGRGRYRSYRDQPQPSSSAPVPCETLPLQGSWLCGACVLSYFAVGDGTCRRCPVVDSVWSRFSPLIYIICAVLGLVAAVWCILLLVVRLFGGTLAGGASRMVSLFIWAITTVQVRVTDALVRVALLPKRCACAMGQVLSNAAAVTSPALTPAMRSIYAALSVLQFEVSATTVLPPPTASDGCGCLRSDRLLQLLQGILLPPACTGSYAFEAEVSL